MEEEYTFSVNSEFLNKFKKAKKTLLILRDSKFIPSFIKKNIKLILETMSELQNDFINVQDFPERMVYGTELKNEDFHKSSTEKLDQEIIKLVKK